MATMKPFSLVALGLKGTGKTTYLAALWHLLEDDLVTSCAKLADLQPDREYLQTIRSAWLELSAAQRTSAGLVQHASLNIQVDGVPDSVKLNVPDLSGELFSAQWETRQTTEFYSSLVKTANGVLLFLHPSTIHGGQEAAQAVLSTQDVPAWTPAMAPTQVQLVDCLQFVARFRASASPLRLAVVVSAWDLVRSGLTPRDWFERRLPLLAQFLSSTEGGFDAAYYGVSAQGGRWPEDKDALQGESPASRAFIVDEAGKGADLARPLRWLVAGIRD